MLGRAVFSFSICVNQGPEIKYCSFPSASAIVLLKSATSRVVIPRRVRTSFNLPPGSKATPFVKRAIADYAKLYSKLSRRASSTEQVLEKKNAYNRRRKPSSEESCYC